MTSGISLTIGADPEFFLFKRGRPVSAHGLIPGDKLNPHKVKHGAVQVDGTALEFNIDPCATKEEFSARIQAVLDQIRAMVPEEYKFKFVPTVDYAKTYFDKLPEAVKELGCTPDYNAMNNGVRNPKPRDIGTMRTGSGHLHLGWTKDKDINDQGHRWDCCYIVRQLDNFFNSYRHYWDTDTKRAMMYGAPGAFRYKPYGVEYRSLSNAWLNYPELWPWIFTNTQAIFNHCLTSHKTIYRTVIGEQEYFPGRFDYDTNKWIEPPRHVKLDLAGRIARTNKAFAEALGPSFSPFPATFKALDGKNMDEIEDEIYDASEPDDDW